MGADTPVGLRLVTPELRRTWKLIRRGAAAPPARNSKQRVEDGVTRPVQRQETFGLIRSVH